MTKTERLYALAEELRAYSPRPRTARQLAARFEVTARTIVRDIAALQQAGLPIITLPGRNGGYALERARTLGPVSLTATEATALLVALPQLAGTPFAAAARSAVLAEVAPDRGLDSSAIRMGDGRLVDVTAITDIPLSRNA